MMLGAPYREILKLYSKPSSHPNNMNLCSIGSIVFFDRLVFFNIVMNGVGESGLFHRLAQYDENPCLSFFH